MISLDQVMRLEEKVESAVKKIQQLQEENAALRTKCDELTNALSLKTEQLSNFTSDQNQIEIGIKNALERLDSIENTVLKNGENPVVQVVTQVTPEHTQSETSENPMNFNSMQEVQKEAPEVQEDLVENETVLPTENQQTSNIQENTIQENPSSIVTYNSPIPEQEPVTENVPEEYEEDSSEEDQDGLGFDIF